MSDCSGAVGVEYGLIVALMTLVLVVGLSQLGGNASGSWGKTASSVSAALK